MKEKIKILPGFKSSPLGPIPSDWEVKTVESFGEVKRGAGSQYIEYLETGGIRLIRINDFFENNPVYIQPTADIMRFAIAENDILFAGTGASAGASYIPKDEWIGLPHSYNAPRIRIKTGENREFILYALQSNYVFKQQLEMFVGAAQPFLDTTSIACFKLITPPLPEQRSIAACLNTWDKAIQTTQKLIEQKELQKKWLMQMLLTGKKRLKGFEKEKWKKVGAGEIFKNITIKGFSNEELLSATQDKGMIPRTMLEGRVTMPTSGTEGFKLVEKGDFVISLRSFQGGIEYSYYRGLVSPAYTVLKPKIKINEEFYKQYYKSYDFIGHLATAVIGIRDGKQISYDDYCLVRIPSPSLEEQTAIANVLLSADKEIQTLKNKLEKLKEQKQGLMQILLTGKKRITVRAMYGFKILNPCCPTKRKNEI